MPESNPFFGLGGDGGIESGGSSTAPPGSPPNPFAGLAPPPSPDFGSVQVGSSTTAPPSPPLFTPSAFAPPGVQTISGAPSIPSPAKIYEATQAPFKWWQRYVLDPLASGKAPVGEGLKALAEGTEFDPESAGAFHKAVQDAFGGPEPIPDSTRAWLSKNSPDLLRFYESATAFQRSIATGAIEMADPTFMIPLSGRLGAVLFFPGALEAAGEDTKAVVHELQDNGWRITPELASKFGRATVSDAFALLIGYGGLSGHGRVKEEAKVGKDTRFKEGGTPGPGRPRSVEEGLPAPTTPLEIGADVRGAAETRANPFSEVAQASIEAPPGPPKPETFDIHSPEGVELRVKQYMKLQGLDEPTARAFVDLSDAVFNISGVRARLRLDFPDLDIAETGPIERRKVPGEAPLGVEERRGVPQETLPPTGEIVKESQSPPTFFAPKLPGPYPPGLTPSTPHPEIFPQQVMEATRRVEALARYKKLPANVRGQFVYNVLGHDKRIEMRDVRETKTMGHELGHAIDLALWPQNGLHELQFGKRFGSGKGEHTLRAELMSISQLLRPYDPKVSKTYDKYRRSASELFADFTSLYIYDPATARQMAPTFASLYEKHLQSVPEIKQLYDELHQGNVIPITPEKPGFIGEPLPEGDIQPRDVVVVKNPVAKEAAETLVKEETRRARGEYYSASRTAKQWRDRLTEEQLEDIGAAVEGTGNLRKRGDTIDDVNARMTPEMKEVLKDYRFQQELQRQEVNKYLEGWGVHEYIAFLEDYLAHFYVGGMKRAEVSPGVYEIQQGVQTPRGPSLARLLKNSPNAKLRKIPTLKEALDAGFIPISQNPAKLLPMWADLNWRVATTKAMVKGLQSIQVVNPDGSISKAVLPSSQAPAGWVEFNHPSFAKIYARPTAKGDTLLWQGSVRVHPAIAPAVRMILDRPFDNGFVRGWERLNGWLKKSALSFSMFHHSALTEVAQATLARARNPFRGVAIIGERELGGEARGSSFITQPHRIGVRLLENPDFVKDAAMAGLTFDASSDVPISRLAKDLASLEMRTKDIPGVGQITRRIRQGNELWDKALWDHYHAGLKALSYYDLVNDALEKHPKVPPEYVKETIASFLNDAYGGQEWQAKFWASPKIQQALRASFLAPDWTLSHLNLIERSLNVKDLAHDKVKRDAILTYWRNVIPTIVLNAVGLQYALYQAFGDDKQGDHPWVWQNEKDRNFWDIDITPLVRKLPWWHEEDTRRKSQRTYLHFAKPVGEIFRWFYAPIEQARTKASPLVQTVLEQLTGTEAGGWDAPFRDTGLEGGWDRITAVAEKVVPFSFRGSNFGLTAPVKKGMTYFRTVKAYKQALDLYADPSLIRRFAYEGPEGVVKHFQTPDFTKNLGGLVEDITDAGALNGVETDKALKRALADTHAKYYALFLSALDKKDMSGAEKYGRAIMRLHAHIDDVLKSSKGRGYTFSRAQLAPFLKPGVSQPPPEE